MRDLYTKDCSAMTRAELLDVIEALREDLYCNWMVWRDDAFHWRLEADAFRALAKACEPEDYDPRFNRNTGKLDL